MALFKVFKGKDSEKIINPSASGYKQPVDGYAYYDTSSKLFYIDAAYDPTHPEIITREPINAAYAGVAGNSLNGVYYGTCTNSEAVKAKVATLVDARGFSLQAGTIVAIKFTNASAEEPMTLNVAGTGAKALRAYDGTNMGSSIIETKWTAGSVVSFIYDGSVWLKLNNEENIHLVKKDQIATPSDSWVKLIKFKQENTTGRCFEGIYDISLNTRWGTVSPDTYNFRVFINRRRTSGAVADNDSMYSHQIISLGGTSASGEKFFEQVRIVRDKVSLETYFEVKIKQHSYSDANYITASVITLIGNKQFEILNEVQSETDDQYDIYESLELTPNVMLTNKMHVQSDSVYSQQNDKYALRLGKNQGRHLDLGNTGLQAKDENNNVAILHVQPRGGAIQIGINELNHMVLQRDRVDVRKSADPTQGDILQIQPTGGLTQVQGDLKTKAVYKEKFISMPADGRLELSGYNNVGALKITLPVSYTNTYVRFQLDICEYSANNNVITYFIGGNNNASGGGYWAQCGAVSTRNGTLGNLPIRFGNDGEKSFIAIGEVDTSWSRPIIQIHSISIGFSQANENTWGSGWQLELITEIPEKIDKTIQTPGVLDVKHGGTGATTKEDARTNLGALENTNTGAADRPIYISENKPTATTYRMAATNATAGSAGGIDINEQIPPSGVWYAKNTSSTNLASDGAVYTNKYSDTWVHQLYGDYRTGQLAARGMNNGTWTGWKRILDSENYSNYTVTKDGTGATGLWDISVTGSANKLADDIDVGSSLSPTYFENGYPVEGIGKSIPYIIGTSGGANGKWLGSLEGLTEYYDGLLILYKIPIAGAATTTLDINSLGAKTIYTNNTGKLTTHFPVNQPILLVYSANQNNGCWMCVDDYWTNSNTVPSISLETAAGTAAKVGVCTYWVAKENSYIHVNIRYANTANSAITLNTNSTGAKPIYINGEPSSATNCTLPAGSYIAFYDGEKYQFRTDGLLPGDGIIGNAATADALTINGGSPTRPVYFKNGKPEEVKSQQMFFSGVCATESGVAIKEVECSDFGADDLVPGVMIAVRFNAINSSAPNTLKLNVNNTGAKPIKFMNQNVVRNLPLAGLILINQVYIFHYDGTNWVIDNIHYIEDSDAYQRVWKSATDVELPIAGINTSNSAVATYTPIVSARSKNVQGAIPENEENTATINPSTGKMTVPGGISTSATPVNDDDVITKGYAESLFATNDALIFKGTIGTNGTVSALPNPHEQGWVYKVITAGTYAGQTCEVGDTIYCIVSGETSNNAHWSVVQTNIDGAVTGPTSASNNAVAIFNGTTGKIIKNSGFTIGKSVPSNALFTDDSVTSVAHHYTPQVDTTAELTGTIEGSASPYSLNTEYSVLTGIKAQRDEKGHIVGLSYTAQKIKDTNTTYTLHGLIGVNTIGSSTKPVYWNGMGFQAISSYEGAAALNVLKAGDTMTGPLKVNGISGTTDVDYGEVLPTTGTEGKIFFQISDGINTAGLINVTNATANTNYYLVGTSGINAQAPHIAGPNANASNNTGGIYFNGSTGILYGTSLANDYAEFRAIKEIKDEIPYGRVVIENGDDTVSLSTGRLQPCGQIVSDTFGFTLGNEENSVPVALCGRALAYPFEDRASYTIGDAVCTGPNGTVSKMTREEIKEWPDKILGYVSSIPNYDYWNNKKVDNRIWIKVV